MSQFVSTLRKQVSGDEAASCFRFRRCRQHLTVQARPQPGKNQKSRGAMPETPETVLVTGASGRLGSQIVSCLVDAGLTVVATDRISPTDRPKLWGPREQEVTFVEADLCDADAMQGLVTKVTSVIHVAAIPGPSKHPPPQVKPVSDAPIGLEEVPGIELMRQNLLGTSMLFEAIAAQATARRVVFSSSLFAMGWSHEPSAFMPEFLPLDEEHVAEPLEHYGLSKCFCEDFAAMLVRAPGYESQGLEDSPPRKRQRKGSLSFISLRFSNIIKAEKWQDLPMRLPEHAVTPLMWAYCHEHDVVDAHVKALLLPLEQLPSKCLGCYTASCNEGFAQRLRPAIR